LVTGVHGFVGSTLARMVGIEGAFADVELVTVAADLDLRSQAATDAMVVQAVPDLVIHLAAQSFVPESMRDPEATLNINVIGTLHLLQALRKSKFDGRMLYVSTGDIYGLVPETALPITEERPPSPRNPYAVSKVAAEALCYQWTVTEGMEIVIARPFNHIGPRQSNRFAVADFAQQVFAIAQGQREPVVVTGDIDVTRDFTDVRDVVDAYFALLQRGVSGQVYNICSGIERSLRSILEQLIAMANINVRIEQDSARMRKTEQRRVRGDPSKIMRETGWRAATPIESSLRAMLQEIKTEGKHV
jgi:GDP-4-dehydro-6-deoxy-D-mannose reductase